MKRILLALSAIALAGFCSVSTQAALAQTLPSHPITAFRPALLGNTHASAVRGIWNLPGYGHLFDVRAGAADVDAYAYAGHLCWRDPAASGEEANNLVAYYASTRRPPDMVFANSPDGAQFHAERLAQVPAPCLRAANRNSPLYTFDAIALSLAQFYPYSAQRQVNWPLRAARLRPQAAMARDDAALKPIVERLFDGLDDPHAGVSGDGVDIGQRMGKATGRRLWQLFRREHPDDGDFIVWLDGWRQDEDRKVAHLLQPGSYRRALDGVMSWGLLPGNIGYLSVGRMFGFGGADGSLAGDRQQLAAALDDALRELQSTDALVLDLSNNLGGYEQVSSDIAARFADRTRLAFTRHAPGAFRAAPQPHYVTPGGNVRYARPVYLLTSEVTVSAGEELTLLMRTLPQLTQVGDATQGALAGGLARGLPNGWQLGMPNDVTLDAQGVGYEVRGIPPALAFAVYPAADFGNGRVHAVERAALLAAQRRGR